MRPPSAGWALVLVLGLAWPAAARRPACSDGRFEVEGAPLVASGATDRDALVLDGRALALVSGCPATTARVRARQRGTSLRARWASCGTLGRVKLTARIERPDCGTVTGVVRARQGRRGMVRPFQARRVIEHAAAVVPRPADTAAYDPPGAFVLDAGAAVLVEAGRDDVAAVGAQLVELLRRALPGLGAAQAYDGDTPPGHALLLTTAGGDPSLGREGYLLRILPDRVVVRAPDAAGLRWAVQTLRQLLGPGIEPPVDPAATWSLPTLRIADAPRFAWRGYMLDVSRAFFPVEYLLKTLDVLALYKLNVLHLHLTDDQGWRFESRNVPALHQLGSTFDPLMYPAERNGYYTQDELRQVVAHASALGIDVVPEIEMPGHAVAALHALPELACTATPQQVRTAAEFPIIPYFDGVTIHPEILCACDEYVLAVLETVLDEVADVFPGPYVHIGGDEVPKTEWEQSWRCQALVAALGLRDMEHVQAWFTKRIEDLLRARGKRLIAWDEALTAEAAGDDGTRLSPEATLMHWRAFGPPPPGLYTRDVVRTPALEFYLDFGIVTLETTYAYEPVPDALDPAAAAHVIGVQGNMWTGFPWNRTEPDVEDNAFPRTLAIAEVGWSPRARRDLPDFLGRLPAELTRLERLGVNYRR